MVITSRVSSGNRLVMSLREYTNSKNWKMLWHLLWVTLIVVIYNLYRYYHEDDSYDYSPVETDTSDNIQKETNMEETISTRQLALDIIEHIGSEPKYTEEGYILAPSLKCMRMHFVG